MKTRTMSQNNKTMEAKSKVFEKVFGGTKVEQSFENQIHLS